MMVKMYDKKIFVESEIEWNAFRETASSVIVGVTLQNSFKFVELTE